MFSTADSRDCVQIVARCDNSTDTTQVCSYETVDAIWSVMDNGRVKVRVPMCGD